MSSKKRESREYKLRRGMVFNHIIQGVVSVPVPLRAFVYVLLAMLAVFVVVLTQFSYANAERVQGYLLPSGGMVRVGAPYGWIVTEVHVQRDQAVSPGDPLLTVTRDPSLGDSTGNAAGMREAFKRQLSEVERQAQSTRGQSDVEGRQIDELLRRQQESASYINRQLEDQARLVSEYRQRRDKVKQLLDEQIATLDQYTQVNTQYLQAARDYQELLLRRAESEKTTAKLRSDREALRQRTSSAMSELEIKQQEYSSRLLSNRDSTMQVVRAPVAGMVVKVDVTRGSTITSSDPVLEMQPESARELIAELYVPSQRAGFVKPGQEVRLAYHAFPIEKFGTFPGTVMSVSSSAYTASELRLHSEHAQASTYFKVQVRLQEQTPVYKSQPLATRAGMTLDGDILLERRTLLEWLFEPLYRLRNRLFGDRPVVPA